MTRVVVVGGGIIGVATAHALSRDGAAVTLVHQGGIGAGATAAAMGHLISLDDAEPIAVFTLHSLELWRALALPPACERVTCGCLWVAEDDEEMQEAHAKVERYTKRGVACELIDAKSLRTLEPQLAADLVGGLRVPSDAVIYPPAAAQYLLEEARAYGTRTRHAQVAGVEPGQVHLQDGTTLESDWVVVATGDRMPELLPQLPVAPRKGHLLITSRRATFVQHQVVELGYIKKAHGRAPESVACNVQPRVTGQVLVGSSRQLDTRDPRIEPHILGDMLRRATRYFPALPELTALRAWTGFRAVTPDGAPLIGVLEPGLAVAGGHEGVGITQAPATAELLSHLLLGRPTSLDPTSFDPHRFQEAA